MRLINANSGTAAIQIDDTGFYQVTFGVMSSATNNTPWSLEINGVQISQYQTNNRAAGQMDAITVIIQITTSGSSIAFVNNTGANRNIVDSGGTGVTPCAFLTIVKVGGL